MTTENAWDREPEDQTNEMLVILARRVFARRRAGLDQLDFSDLPWNLSRERAAEYMEEALKRGLIE